MGRIADKTIFYHVLPDAATMRARSKGITVVSKSQGSTAFFFAYSPCGYRNSMQAALTYIKQHAKSAIQHAKKRKVHSGKEPFRHCLLHARKEKEKIFLIWKILPKQPFITKPVDAL
jgi:hypothetical protein